MLAFRNDGTVTETLPFMVGKQGLYHSNLHGTDEMLHLFPSESAAHVGTVIGGIVFFLTYLPYLYITFSYHQRTYFQKIAFCLFSNVAMAIGVRFISLFEAKGKIYLS